MPGERRTCPQDGECWIGSFAGAGLRLGAGPRGGTLALLPPNLGRVSPRQEGNIKARILSRGQRSGQFPVSTYERRREEKDAELVGADHQLGAVFL